MKLPAFDDPLTASSDQTRWNTKSRGRVAICFNPFAAMTVRLKLLLGALAVLLGVATLRNLLGSKPGPGAAAAKLAQQSSARGELANAIQQWRQAVIAEPSNGDFHGELGNAYLSARDYDLAVAELQAAAYLLSLIHI